MAAWTASAARPEMPAVGNSRAKGRYTDFGQQISLLEQPMDDSPPVSPWPTLERGEATDFNVFSVRPVRRRSPRTGREGTYQVIEAPDWVNVIARTADRQVILIEQFRHGVDALTLEIPGGMIEPGEDPAAAGARELEEETGFVGDPPILLGRVEPNPAIQSNACFTYLIDNARAEGTVCWDDGEDILVVPTPLDSIGEYMSDGRITHSLVVAAFHWLSLHDVKSAEPSAKMT